MINKILCFLVVIAAVSPAWSGQINFDLRVDSRSQDFNSAAETAGVGQDNQKYYFQTGKLDFRSELNSDLQFRLRFLLAGRDQGVVTQRDSTNETLELAFIKHKLSEDWNLAFGKIATGVGGFEGQTSTSAQYWLSESHRGTRYLSGSSTYRAQSSGYGFLRFGTGAQASYSYGSGEVTVTGLNTHRDQPTPATSSSFEQNENMLGLAWKHSWAEKEWTLMATTHLSGPAKDEKFQVATFGIERNKDNWVTVVESISVTDQLAPESKCEISTIHVSIKQMFESWASTFKYSGSLERISTTSDIKNSYQGLSIGAEYQPWKDQAFRYHIAVNHGTMRPDVGAGDTRSVTELIAGFAINADFLK